MGEKEGSDHQFFFHKKLLWIILRYLFVCMLSSIFYPIFLWRGRFKTGGVSCQFEIVLHQFD